MPYSTCICKNLAMDLEVAMDLLKVSNWDAPNGSDTTSKESIEVKTITVIGFKSDENNCPSNFSW